jgi:hypothetical protein
LTETFTNRYNLRAFLHLHARALPPPVPSVASTTGGSSISSNVSGLTLPSGAEGERSSTAPAPASTGGSAGSSRVDNDNFNDNLFGAYKTSALKSKAIRDKVKAGTLPALPVSKRDSSKPMCLAWHTKGVCNKQCPCVYDHVTYSAEEYAPMVAWCRDHGYAT